MGLFDQKTALVIADMIVDFVDRSGKLYVPGIEEIVPEISSLIDQAHEAGAPVIFVNDAHDPDDIEFRQWGEHALAGSTGAQVVPDLGPSEEDHVLKKKKYTVFYETGLQDLLEKMLIGRVVITGTVTNICVMVSAIEALMMGFKVTVPKRAVKGLNEADHNFALDQLERVFGAQVV
ncbi:MAG TPA: isochorismatase family cysteine hydrolase [Candidatus Anoxymicrobiaceae bacterium]|jgi:nicotinamidase/pyrazinamidase